MDGRSVVGGLAGCSVVGLEDEKSGRSSHRKKKHAPHSSETTATITSFVTSKMMA